jgi:predicted lipid-binding transport protein (Tim44 family)
MGATGSFPIDLILFGMIAAFLVLRLRSILGRRTGFERQEQPQPQPPRPVQPGPGPIIEGKAEPPAPASPRVVPDPNSALGQTLARMRAMDRSFDPARFLDGAEKAFGMIVGAFAAGDRQALRALLSDETYQAFEHAITARESLGQTQVSDIRAIPSVSVEEAELKGSVASVGVRIVSDQVSYTKGSDGHPVVGTDAVTEITDVWTFERDLAKSDPTWRLVAARSA